MNCKFCNNFIPDDAKICSICGKNVEEEALVKAETEAVAVAAETTAAPEKPAKVYKQKSLLLPFIIILIAVAAFVYLYAFGGMTKLAGYQAGRDTDNTVSQTEIVDDDSIDVGEFTDDTVQQNNAEDSAKDLTMAYGANALAGLVGIGGAALLGKRAIGNSKAKKQ